MSNPLRITVVAAPGKVNVGEFIQISAIVTDKFGAPQFVPRLYMEILDSKGRDYWKLSLVERDNNGFSKLISTNEMKSNTRYTVRVSTNTALSPQGFTNFQTKKSKIIPAFIPVLLAPLILIPKQAKNPIWLVYRTELDKKVCSICAPHQGKKFRPNDDKIIRIGPPQLGGETHYGCRCHYNMQLDMNPAYAKVQKQLKAIHIVMAINNFKKKAMAH